MNSELGQLMNQTLLYPLVFVAALIVIFSFLGAIIYYQFLAKWVPEKLASFVWFIGAAFILFKCVDNFDKVKDITKNWTTTGFVIGFIALIVMFGIIMGLLPSKRTSSIKKSKNSSSRPSKKQPLRSVQEKSDHTILDSSFSQLSGAEFERLLALYFRDQGYTVHEVGVGGKDGGVDLVIIDQRGEKTAVQAKCYADRNHVGVGTVRELVGAKRNHDCILSLLITTSDLTEPAKKEAEKFKVDYWHGAILEQKLKAWGKWKPNQKSMVAVEQTARAQIKKSQAEIATSNDKLCSCGAPMVIRTSKEGKQFMGCSTFPKCRHTKSI
ncbi:restriction endonuclease [Paenibacillus ferrarius]|uniref:restriction endonuclease n=1 Tax=Paenibacillus ferrarius TaxID=1469647 RepID=UPI003D2839B5